MRDWTESRLPSWRQKERDVLGRYVSELRMATDLLKTGSSTHTENNRILWEVVGEGNIKVAIMIEELTRLQLPLVCDLNVHS